MRQEKKKTFGTKKSKQKIKPCTKMFQNELKTGKCQKIIRRWYNSSATETPRDLDENPLNGWLKFDGQQFCNVRYDNELYPITVHEYHNSIRVCTTYRHTFHAQNTSKTSSFAKILWYTKNWITHTDWVRFMPYWCSHTINSTHIFFLHEIR